MKTLLLFFGTILSSLTYSQPPFESLDSLFTGLHDKGEFNGMVLAAKGDKIVFSRAYGFADVNSSSPIDASTQFYVASLSKQFTAAAVLQLVDQEKFRLDDPVNSILGKFPYEYITIRHLLNNTSGIADYIDYFAEHWNKRKQATTDDVVEYIFSDHPASRVMAAL